MLSKAGLVASAAVLLCALVGAPAALAADSAQPVPKRIADIMAKPRYATANWSLLAVDADNGKTLYSLNPDTLAFTGSTRKLFSTAAAMRALGPGGRQRTRVFRRGRVKRGVLHGSLILRASGDLAFGGRRINANRIAVTNFDHGDANTLGTAILTRQEPLYALNRLARQIRAAGIRRVRNVAIDDRLFKPYHVPNSDLLITPMMLNENLVDVEAKGTGVGRPAKLSYRPRTAAFKVRGSIATTAPGSKPKVSISGGGLINCIGSFGCSGTVGGSVPLGYRWPLSNATSFVGTFRALRPAEFARTAFIDALRRHGVKVSAMTLGSNPRRLLPARSRYPASTRVALYRSAPYAQTARLVNKVSLGLGANISLSLFGRTSGARTIRTALAAERRTLTKDFGINGSQFNFPTNGSGSPDSQAAPRALVQLLRKVRRSSFARPFQATLPIMGVDGSLATTGNSLPGRGHVFAKPGTTVTGSPAGIQLKAQNLAGYIKARSGRTIAYAVMVNNVGTIQSVDDAIAEVFQDEGEISSVIFETQ